MSIYVNSDVSNKEKRILTRNEHQSLIMKLQSGEIEDTMRLLKNYRLDKSFEETMVVLQLLESLCNRTHLGIIVEWTIRQMMNEGTERKIQPFKYPRKPLIVGDKRPARRYREKEASLHMQFLRYKMSQKIASDPEDYFDEKEIRWHLFDEYLDEKEKEQINEEPY